MRLETLQGVTFNIGTFPFLGFGVATYEFNFGECLVGLSIAATNTQYSRSQFREMRFVTADIGDVALAFAGVAFLICFCICCCIACCVCGACRGEEKESTDRVHRNPETEIIVMPTD